MGLNAVLTPNQQLQNLTEMWGHVFFWSVLLSIAIFLLAGIALAVSVPVLKKWLRVLIPFFYLIYVFLRLLLVEAIASAFIASIYKTSGWGMTSGVAIAWGLGLSLVTNLLGLFISCVPVYDFL